MTGPAVLLAAERATDVSLVGLGKGRAAVAAATSAGAVALYLAGWSRFGTTPALLAWCWACALGGSLALADLRCRRLPFPLVAALAGGGLVVLLGVAVVDGRWGRFAFAGCAAVTVFVVAALVQALAPGHTGGGDTALYGALALYLGWFGWDGLQRGLLMATGCTAVVAVLVALCSRRMKTTFPAGPSLLVGALSSMLMA